LIFLAFLLPPAIYFLLLGFRTRRRHPLLRSAVADFAGVLFAASGFLLAGGPAVLHRVYEEVRLHQALGRARWLDGIGENWYFWLALWGLYSIVVFGGAYLLLWRRRNQTSIYNLEPGRCERLLAQVLERIALLSTRNEDGSILIGSRNGGNLEMPAARAAADVPDTRFGDKQVLTATEAFPLERTAVLKIESFRALRHLTLHWSGAYEQVRQQVESEFAETLHHVPAAYNPASNWFLGLSMGLFLISSSLSLLLIIRSLRPFW
jgi:hypothetical protein